MSRRGENIYKRKDGRWEGRYIVGRKNGKAVYKSVYAHTYTDAKQKLYKRETEIKPVIADNISFDCYANQWLNIVKLSRKASTYNKYKSIYNLHIRPVVSDCKINAIGNSHIQNIIDNCSDLSPKTINDILCVVKMILEYTRQNGTAVNVCMKGMTVRQERKEMRVLTVDEQKRLTSVLLSETDLKKLGVYLALCTGIRIGELCALRRENINFDTGMLSVRSTMQRVQIEDSTKKTKIIITEPKSRCSVRDIPLPKFLLDLCRKYYSNFQPSFFLLTGTTHYLEPRALRYNFKKYISESGLKNVNFHALRHTFATRCVENGFEIKTLSEILGHVNVNITLNRYVHPSVDLKRANMEKMNGIF